MRKLAGILCAAVVALPVPFITDDASAAGGVTCTSLKGTEVWNPPLPRRNATRKTKPTITIRKAKLADCTSSDGKLERGSFNGSIRWQTKGNCDTLMTHTPGEAEPRIRGTINIVWNTGKASLVQVSLRRTKPYVQKITGMVISGPYTDSQFAAHLLMDPPDGACDTKPLQTVPFDGLTNLTIK